MKAILDEVLRNFKLTTSVLFQTTATRLGNILIIDNYLCCVCWHVLNNFDHLSL